MKSEDMLVYLGYFAVAAIALHFILAVLKVQSDYIYNTSIGFPNDNLKGSVIEGFQEGFVSELSEKEIDNLKKAGDEIDVILTKEEKDRLEPAKKRIKSCPQDTLDAIKEIIEYIDEESVVSTLLRLINKGNADPKKFITGLVTDKQFMKIIADDGTKKKILMKVLEGNSGW